MGVIHNVEPVAELYDSEKSEILSQVEKEKLRFSDSLTAAYPRRVGEEARSQPDSKERFCASKSFAIGSLVALFSVCFWGVLSAEEEIERFSEAMGHMIGKNFQSMGLKVDLEALLRGIEAEAKGERSPLEEEECIEWMAAYQQEHLGKVAAENLAKAEAFLEENQKREEIHILEGGKLQYEILQEGSGEIVQSYNTPLVRLKGRFQNGDPIGEMEESLALDRAIAGISLGLVGMHSGEKRILYVHPDLGFPDQRGAESGSLLVFEVEVLQADVSSSASAADDGEGDVLLKLPEEIELPKEAIDAAER